MKTTQLLNQPFAETSLDHQSDNGFARLYQQYVDKVLGIYLPRMNDETATPDYTREIFHKAFDERNPSKSFVLLNLAVGYRLQSLPDVAPPERRPKNGVTDTSEQHPTGQQEND